VERGRELIVSDGEKRPRRAKTGMWLGILLGIAIGVVVALLLAPQPGEETRRQLAEQRGQIRRRFDEAIEQGREAYDRSREEVLNRVKQPEAAH
jgi:gas vesicle protein